MSAAENSLVVPPPRKSIVIVISAVTQAFTLPVEWAQSWVECHNNTDDVAGVIFGTNEPEVTAMADLTVTSTIAVDGSVDQPSGVPGVLLEPGERTSYSLAEIAFLPGELNNNSLIWCAVVGPGTGAIRLTKSSGFVRA